MMRSSEGFGSFEKKLPNIFRFDTKGFNMFLEPSCVVVGHIYKPPKETISLYENYNIKLVFCNDSCFPIFWESLTSSVKNEIRIPELYKGEVFLAGREFGKQYLDPYGDSQVVCDLDGNILKVSAREKSRFLFVTDSGEIAAINCTATAGGKEISIIEYYLTKNNNKFFVSKKKIFSEHLDFVDLKTFGDYSKAVGAALLKAFCYDCNHLHYGEE